MTATERVEQLCQQIGGLHPHPAVTEAEWSQWLQGIGSLRRGLRCPECGDHLVERQGQFGPFLGCESWPGCKFTCKG